MCVLLSAGKFGGLFASLPNAMVSGLFCVMFGIICAVGLSQMQYTDQHSNRNIFILGEAMSWLLKAAHRRFPAHHCFIFGSTIWY